LTEHFQDPAPATLHERLDIGRSELNITLKTAQRERMSHE
jgi:hypothetical protein